MASYAISEYGYIPGVENRRTSLPASLTIEVVSDLICPWCYIGKRRLERATRLLEPQRVIAMWRAFQLNPGMPVEGMDRREYRTRKFGSWERSQILDTEVTTAGKAVGIAFEFGAITRTPNTLAGHKLLWLAGERACQDVVAEKLFSAYFVEGRDIGDVQVLQRIGLEAGLLSKDIEDALTSATVNAAVAEEEEHARDAGIRGVPTFTVRGMPLVSGAQPERLLANVLEQASAANAVRTDTVAS